MYIYLVSIYNVYVCVYMYIYINNYTYISIGQNHIYLLRTAHVTSSGPLRSFVGAVFLFEPAASRRAAALG